MRVSDDTIVREQLRFAIEHDSEHAAPSPTEPSPIRSLARMVQTRRAALRTCSSR